MDIKLIKCIESSKKIPVAILFQNIQKVQEIFVIIKKTTVKFSPKSEQKRIHHNFFNYREAQPTSTTVFEWDFIPTPLPESSTPRPLMKDNRFKFKSTGSRVLSV